MDPIITNLIIYTSSLTLSLSYCYYISSKIPTGIYRFISLTPILFLFTILPLQCSSIATTAIASSFTTWLTNFKLIRFAFDLDHSPFHPSDSLIRFITLSSLPIKSNVTDASDVNSRPDRFRLGLQVLIFSILIQIVINYKQIFHPNFTMLVYCVVLFLTIDLTVAIINSLLFSLTGLELEPPSNHPYLATSLQNFWGRWNLMVTNTLRHTVYKPVRLAFSNHKWAPLAGVLASFIVSGLMHELFVYHLSREAPTWEMTLFFVLHGICVVVEMVVKRWVTRGRWWWSGLIARVLTGAFVVTTGMWLFFPPLIRSRIDERILDEYTSVIEFIKAKVFTLRIYVSRTVTGSN